MKKMNIDLELINDMVDQGYIYQKKHPSCRLWIYNYAPKVQVEAKWNKATMISRGLILDKFGKVVARPFEKFFSLDQLSVIRNRTKDFYGKRWQDMWSELHTRPFRAFKKMDGSLGILFWNSIDGRWEVATRGSFQSDQAIKANEILAQYEEELMTPDFKGILDPSYTYMVEIIYPENRIVVRYDDEKLPLLACIKTETGQDDWTEFERVSQYWDVVEEVSGLNYVSQLEGLEDVENEEGYVLVYPNGFRLKFKFEEYKRLHRIMTEITPKRIWDLLRFKTDMRKYLEGVPDEFYDEVMEQVYKFESDYKAIEESAIKLADETKNTSRKRIALKYSSHPCLKIIFSIRDGKDYSDAIWKMIKPTKEQK